MTKQQFQLATFNRWCELSDEEREEFHYNYGLMQFIKNQPNYYECSNNTIGEFDELFKYMTIAMTHGYQAMIGTREIFDDSTNKTTVYVVLDYSDGYNEEYEIDVYNGQRNNDRTDASFYNYVQSQIEHPTNFIFIKNASDNDLMNKATEDSKMQRQNFYFYDTKYNELCNKTNVSITLVDLSNNSTTTTSIGFYDGQPNATKTQEQLQAYHDKQVTLMKLLDQIDSMEQIIRATNANEDEHILRVAEMQLEATSIVLDTMYDETYIAIVHTDGYKVLSAKEADYWMRLQ